MSIGEMIRNDNGTVTGWVAEPGFDFDLFLDRIASEKKDEAHFRVMTRSPRGRNVPLGEIWQRAAQETGEIYFRGYINSSASGYVSIRLFRSQQRANVWDVIRNKPQRRQARPQDTALAGHEPAAPARQATRRRKSEPAAA